MTVASDKSIITVFPWIAENMDIVIQTRAHLASDPICTCFYSCRVEMFGRIWNCAFMENANDMDHVIFLLLACRKGEEPILLRHVGDILSEERCIAEMFSMLASRIARRSSADSLSKAMTDGGLKG